MLLNFCNNSRSILCFSMKFQLALSSPGPSSCNVSQSSPSCNSAIRTTLAYITKKAHMLHYSILRYYTLNAITSRCSLSNRCIRNFRTLNIKIVSREAGFGPITQGILALKYLRAKFGCLRWRIYCTDKTSTNVDNTTEAEFITSCESGKEAVILCKILYTL